MSLKIPLELPTESSRGRASRLGRLRPPLPGRGYRI